MFDLIEFPIPEPHRRAASQLAARLASLDLPSALLERLARSVNPDRLFSDPYLAISTVPDYSLDHADRIASHLRIPLDDPRRLAGQIRATLNRAAQSNGHLWLTPGQLTTRLATLPNPPAIRPEDSPLPPDIQRCQDRYYLRSHLAVAQAIEKTLSQQPTTTPLFPGSNLQYLLDDIELQHWGFGYLDLSQRQALLGVLSSDKPIHLILGGAGFGKRSLIPIILTVLAQRWATVHLCATEVNRARELHDRVRNYGWTANTLWNQLGGHLDMTGEISVSHDAAHPLSADLIIVDGADALDSQTAALLFDALKPGAHLLLLADPDTIGPAGPGNLLADLCTRAVDIHRLDTPHHPDRGIQNVLWSLRNGQLDPSEYTNVRNRLCETPLVTLPGLVDQVLEARCRHEDPDDHLVIVNAPYHPPPNPPASWSLREVNRALQQRLNRPSAANQIHGTDFQIGDPVRFHRAVALPDPYALRRQESAPLNLVQQGTQARITALIHQPDGKPLALLLRLEDQRELALPLNETKLNETNLIQLAYALSPQAALGQAAREVLCLMPNVAPELTTREHFYTAASPATHQLTLFGNWRTLENMAAIRRPPRQSCPA